jgi:hypothetical protein
MRNCSRMNAAPHHPCRGDVAVQGRIQREGEVGRIVNAEVPRPFKRMTL